MRVNGQDPVVETGALVGLRLYDIAYSIDLVKAQALCATAQGAGRRARLPAAEPKAVAFGVPPVTLELGDVRVTLEGREVKLLATARIYDFGAVALELREIVENLAWPLFAARFDAFYREAGPGATHNVWRGLLDELRSLLAPALERPSDSAIEEDYLFAVVHRLDQPLTAAELAQRVDLPALLAGEPRLSESERQALEQRSYSYTLDDLVVLTYDRAFVYEPRGDVSVVEIIEVANAQLLALRYYDELLDAELPHMYDRVEEARRRSSLLSSRRFADLARKLYGLVAEVTELTEKVDNALKVTEDVYLARVYSAALDLFRVPAFSAAVDRKLAIIRDTYAALYDEASSRRAEILEAAIVALIVIDIVLALAGL